MHEVIAVPQLSCVLSQRNTSVCLDEAAPLILEGAVLDNPASGKGAEFLTILEP